MGSVSVPSRSRNRVVGADFLGRVTTSVYTIWRSQVDQLAAKRVIGDAKFVIQAFGLGCEVG